MLHPLRVAASRLRGGMAQWFEPDRMGADAVPHPPSFWGLARLALVMEACFLALIVIAPFGGMVQTVSPLARAWPWLLAPAHLLFPDAALRVGTRPEHGLLPWPAAIFSGLLVVATICAAIALLRCLRHTGSSARYLALTLAGAAVMGATLVLIPSLPSDDVFSYIIYGRIAVLHHANPLVAVPAQFTQDPFLTFVYWRDVRSVYGPIWLLASGGLTMLAQVLGGALSTYVLLFKLFALLCHLVNAVLVWAILSTLAPRRRLLGTLLYAWNPLCLLEFCASSHNDVLMLTFLLLSVLFLVRHWEVPALIAFGLSVATKYVPLALLPFYLYAIARQLMARRGRPSADGVPAESGLVSRPAGGRARIVFDVVVAVAWRVAIVLGVVAICTIPWWAGPSTLEAVLYSPPAERLGNSWQEALYWQFLALAQSNFGLPLTDARNIVQTALKAISLVAFTFVWLRQFRRARGLAGTFEAWAWVLMWYVLVASGWFEPWYVTWAIPLVALLPWSELSVATVVLSGGVLVLYAFRPISTAPIYGYRTIFVFGPAVAYLIIMAWRRRREAILAMTRSPKSFATPERLGLDVASPASGDVLDREGAPSGV